MGQGISVTLWLGSSCVPHGLCSKIGGTTHLLCYSWSSEQHRQNEHVSCSSLRCWSATHTSTNGGCTCHRSTKEKMKSHIEVTSVKRWRLTLDSSQSLPLVFEGPALFFYPHYQHWFSSRVVCHPVSMCLHFCKITLTVIFSAIPVFPGLHEA